MNIIDFFENKKITEILTKRLTRREVQILAMYATQSSAREIADTLHISKKTAENHICNIYKKIDISDELKTKPQKVLSSFYSAYRKEITEMGGYKKCN